MIRHKKNWSSDSSPTHAVLRWQWDWVILAQMPKINEKVFGFDHNNFSESCHVTAELCREPKHRMIRSDLMKGERRSKPSELGSKELRFCTKQNWALHGHTHFCTRCDNPHNISTKKRSSHRCPPECDCHIREDCHRDIHVQPTINLLWRQPVSSSFFPDSARVHMLMKYWQPRVSRDSPHVFRRGYAHVSERQTPWLKPVLRCDVRLLCLIWQKDRNRMNNQSWWAMDHKGEVLFEILIAFLDILLVTHSRRQESYERNLWRQPTYKWMYESVQLGKSEHVSVSDFSLESSKEDCVKIVEALQNWMSHSFGTAIYVWWVDHGAPVHSNTNIAISLYNQPFSSFFSRISARCCTPDSNLHSWINRHTSEFHLRWQEPVTARKFTGERYDRSAICCLHQLAIHNE